APPMKFEFVGGALCLDFCNTVWGKRGAIAREKLHNYPDFLSWSVQADLLDARQAAVLAQVAARHPAAAKLVLNRARHLREAFYRMFAALIERKAPAAADLARINSELAKALGR